MKEKKIDAEEKERRRHMKYKIYEDVLKTKLYDLSWKKENLKRDLTFYISDEQENLEIRKMDYILCNDNAVQMAVLEELDFDEKSVLEEQKNLIDYLYTRDIPFLIFINNRLEILLIEIYSKKIKRIKLEEIEYHKFLNEYYKIMEYKNKQKTMELEVE